MSGPRESTRIRAFDDRDTLLLAWTKAEYGESGPISDMVRPCRTSVVCIPLVITDAHKKLCSGHRPPAILQWGFRLYLSLRLPGSSAALQGCVLPLVGHFFVWSPDLVEPCKMSLQTSTYVQKS